MNDRDSFKQLGDVALDVVRKIAPNGRAPWRVDALGNDEAMVRDADNNPLFHCRGEIADRIVALVNAN